MIIQVFKCRKCQSTKVTRNGKNAVGNPRYKCHDCGTSSVITPIHDRTPERQQEMERAYLERNSLRATGRIFDISHGTVFNKVKKKARALPDFKTSILPAKPEDVLEADELFTFIAIKIRQVRICSYSSPFYCCYN